MCSSQRDSPQPVHGHHGFVFRGLGTELRPAAMSQESLQDVNKFAEDVPRQRMVRNMIHMVDGMNKTDFGALLALSS